MSSPVSSNLQQKLLSNSKGANKEPESESEGLPMNSELHQWMQYCEPQIVT